MSEEIKIEEEIKEEVAKVEETVEVPEEVKEEVSTNSSPEAEVEAPEEVKEEADLANPDVVAMIEGKKPVMMNFAEKIEGMQKKVADAVENPNVQSSMFGEIQKEFNLLVKEIVEDNVKRQKAGTEYSQKSVELGQIAATIDSNPNKTPEDIEEYNKVIAEMNEFANKAKIEFSMMEMQERMANTLKRNIMSGDMIDEYIKAFVVTVPDLIRKYKDDFKSITRREDRDMCLFFLANNNLAKGRIGERFDKLLKDIWKTDMGANKSMPEEALRNSVNAVIKGEATQIRENILMFEYKQIQELKENKPEDVIIPDQVKYLDITSLETFLKVILICAFDAVKEHKNTHYTKFLNIMLNSSMVELKYSLFETLIGTSLNMIQEGTMVEATLYPKISLTEAEEKLAELDARKAKFQERADRAVANAIEAGELDMTMISPEQLERIKNLGIDLSNVQPVDNTKKEVTQENIDNLEAAIAAAEAKAGVTTEVKETVTEEVKEEPKESQENISDDTSIIE